MFASWVIYIYPEANINKGKSRKILFKLSDGNDASEIKCFHKIRHVDFCPCLDAFIHAHAYDHKDSAYNNVIKSSF